MTDEEMSPEQHRAIEQYKKSAEILGETVEQAGEEDLDKQNYTMQEVYAAGAIVLAAELNAVVMKLPNIGQIDLMTMPPPGTPPMGSA